MRRKNKIMLSKNYRMAFDCLSDEEAGRIIKAVFAYDAGEEVDLGPLNTAWLFVKAGLDEEKAEAEEISRVNAENGRRGGRPRREEQPQARGRNDYPDDFKHFWDAYPNKKDKGAAYEKYKARINDGYSPDELLRAAKAYALECEIRHTEPKYIKHAKTFLGPSTPFVDYLGNGTEQQSTNQHEDVDFSAL